MIETRAIQALEMPHRIKRMRDKLLSEPRYLSIEQAVLITDSYRKHQGEPRSLQRAYALASSLENIHISIDRDELIVGNRTVQARAGVVFPEPGISWVDEELESLSSRMQDAFQVRPEDVKKFRCDILPFWQGNSLDEEINKHIGDELENSKMVFKINQTDHAQGHICPHVEKWLAVGPAGLAAQAATCLASAGNDSRDFYQSVTITLEASRVFMRRYGLLARILADQTQSEKRNLLQISDICLKLADYPPETFAEAVQSVWFLFVILQMESNASSFSPGRMDQYLYPYFLKDYEAKTLSLSQALELIEALWLKFNQIVYLRNRDSARYFAGFPIGFNVAIGGQTADGQDASNPLSYLFLQAQSHIGLPQPNLSARLHHHSPDDFIMECSRVIARGSGMPQVFNDESIVPALRSQGISHRDSLNYAIVGCVELSTSGNSLGWSDAAMFNLVKALELAINDGTCLLTGKQIGPHTGCLSDFQTYESLESAFRTQIDFFCDRMIRLCHKVDMLHAEVLPSPFLSSVVDNCLEKGLDVTAGGAYYNLSGIQAIQVANVADSLAALRTLVYQGRKVDAQELLTALRCNFHDHELIRQKCLHAPKYGNDLDSVDELGSTWVRYFTSKLTGYTNARGGPYHTGLYTVSAHLPMGQNVGATPDGRLAQEPLADGGLSPMCGRDRKGPTAVLKSVGKIDSRLASNGTLLNMKFLPQFLHTKTNLQKFSALLKTFVLLDIHHVQFNVVSEEDLLAAKKNPAAYRDLTVRVAGYSAFFTDLAEDLQNEIIARTSHGDV